MTGLLAPTLLRTTIGRALTNMATTKRNLSILRKVSDVTLTYLAIMQAQIATQALTGCQNNRADRVNMLYYLLPTVVFS